MKGIRTILTVALLVVATAFARRGETVTLLQVRGDVALRVGVTETWTKATAGQTLQPDATIRTGKNSTAQLILSVSGKRIALPSEVMVDISDVRELTQEELMLKLTMEKVRAASYKPKNKDLHLPNTTVVHGAEKSASADAALDMQQGRLELNGARVLYENSFYSTSALKSLNVLRRYPPLDTFENRMLVAQALEKAELKGEALNEYSQLLLLPDLSKEQRSEVQARISKLKGGKQ